MRGVSLVLVLLLVWGGMAVADTPPPSLAFDRSFAPSEDASSFPLMPWMALVQYAPGTVGRLTLGSHALLLAPQVQWWLDADAFGAEAPNYWGDLEARWQAGVAEIVLFAGDTSWYSTVRPDTVFVETDSAGRRSVHISLLLSAWPGEDPAMAIYLVGFDWRKMELESARWLRLIVLSDPGEHIFEWNFAG